MSGGSGSQNKNTFSGRCTVAQEDYYSFEADGCSALHAGPVSNRGLISHLDRKTSENRDSAEIIKVNDA